VWAGRRTRPARDSLAGPGRGAQALGSDGAFAGHPLFGPGGLELREGVRPDRVRALPRVGIGFAAATDRERPWRFLDPDASSLSAPRP